MTVNGIDLIGQPASVQGYPSTYQSDYSNDKINRSDSNEEKPDYSKINDEDKEKIIDEAANQMNDVAKTFNRSVRFIVHKESGRIQTEVIDTETQKVIREIPSEEMLDMIAKLDSYIGKVFDIKS